MKLTLGACVVATLLLAVPGAAQDPLQHPLVCVDEPAEGGKVGQTFGIRGSALNSPFVHVWGFPTSGPVWLGEAYANQPDPMRKIGGGVFAVHVMSAPVGTYPIVVYAYESATATFPASQVVNIQVKACQTFTAAWPYFGVTGATTVPLPFCAPQA